MHFYSTESTLKYLLQLQISPNNFKALILVTEVRGIYWNKQKKWVAIALVNHGRVCWSVAWDAYYPTWRVLIILNSLQNNVREDWGVSRIRYYFVVWLMTCKSVLHVRPLAVSAWVLQVVLWKNLWGFDCMPNAVKFGLCPYGMWHKRGAIIVNIGNVDQQRRQHFRFCPSIPPLPPSRGYPITYFGTRKNIINGKLTVHCYYYWHDPWWFIFWFYYKKKSTVLLNLVI